MDEKFYDHHKEITFVLKKKKQKINAMQQKNYSMILFSKKKLYSQKQCIYSYLSFNLIFFLFFFFAGGIQSTSRLEMLIRITGVLISIKDRIFL